MADDTPDAVPDTATDTATDSAAETTSGLDFIRTRVEKDLDAGTHDGRVATRFPPEPNGYLHIGHAKSICLNFGVAAEHGGTCNLRFDDTNPLTEDVEFVDAIQDDVRWLGFQWDELFHASDYFERLYGCAERLVKEGLAYVDSLDEDEIQNYRGTVIQPGRESPFRDRPVEENLDLLRRMRAGEFRDGAHVLRAKIDMAAANMKMRDPLLYRIRHAEHYRTGDEWPIYPMYDFAHPLSDAFEDITHSLCTLEFENNREVYDWLVEALGFSPRPYQIEFARLNLSYTVLSKRRLLHLVEEGHVAGWDDPRMPTLAGLRRRGYTASAIRAFCDAIGVAKSNSVVDVAQLEHAIRDDLNHQAPRVLCVLDPLKVTLTNYPQGESEELEAPYWPHDIPKDGSRKLPFSGELWIEREDFSEDPPKGYRRLAPGREVRLRYGYFIRCDEVIRGDDGEVVELRCTYDPETRGGSSPDGRKPDGTIHWVSAPHAVTCEARLYDRLFTDEMPGSGDVPYIDSLNPRSLQVVSGAKVEPSVAGAEAGSHYQFERNGYFYLDPLAQGEGDDAPLVFNRIVTLRDAWAKRQNEASRPERGRRSRKPETPAAPAKPKDPLAGLSPEQVATAGRFEETYGLPLDEAAILAAGPEVGQLFEKAVAVHDNAEGIANWIIHELLAVLKDRDLGDVGMDHEGLAELVRLQDEGVLSSAGAKQVFEVMVEDGGRPGEIVEEKGLAQVSDEGELEEVVRRVMEANPEEAERYRGGESRLHGWFVGQVMRATGGAADPEVVNGLLRGRVSG